MCGIPENENRILIVGCQHVDGFQAVALGEKVNVEKVTPGMIELAKEVVYENPNVKCILLECTELPPYADSLRAEIGLPVYDAITNCDSFMSGFLDNKNFGLNNWQKKWDGVQDEYKFGDNLSEEEKSKLVNTIEKKINNK